MLDHLIGAAASSAFGGGQQPGTQGHRAYEIRNLPPAYLQDGLEIVEVQFYESLLGLNIAGQAVASASEMDPTRPPAFAIDGNPDTMSAGADNATNARPYRFRLTFPDKRALHHLNLVRGGQSFRFFKQLEIWASDTPDDDASWARLYHTEFLDIFGEVSLYVTNRLWYVEWSDGGTDFSCIAHLFLRDDADVDHAIGGTWTTANNENRFTAAQGVQNLALQNQPAFIYGCRGTTGLVAYTPSTDFDCTKIDLAALDEVNAGSVAGDAAKYTPLTLRVSYSLDGGQTRVPAWSCGSPREFAAGEVRRFYHPKYLARIRLDFGPSQGDQFTGWDRVRIKRRDGTYLDSKIVSITASSTLSRMYHPVYVNDANPDRIWASSAAGGPNPTWMEFAVLLADLPEIGGVEVTAWTTVPALAASSIKISVDTGAGYQDVPGASWSGYANFGPGETRTFNVAG